jgi:hypothetical protein
MAKTKKVLNPEGCQAQDAANQNPVRNHLLQVLYCCGYD